MKSLYEALALEEVKRRFETVHDRSERVWGTMTAAQMVAHCATGMEMALGDITPKRVLIGRLIGPLFKSQYTNDKPWRKSNPTAPELVVSGERNLGVERGRLIQLIERFSRGGFAACTREPHCFFGKLTPEEWGKGMYKHLDHHLKQFGA